MNETEVIFRAGKSSLMRTETSTAANLLDIGIFTKDTKNDKGISTKVPLVLQKVWVKPGKNTFTFTTDELPLKAGIDPYNKMIDRTLDDNMKSVEEAD